MSMEKAGSFLSTLPDDVLGLVVRSLSSKPWHDKWVFFINMDPETRHTFLAIHALVRMVPKVMQATMTQLSDDGSWLRYFQHVAGLLPTVVRIETSLPDNARLVSKLATSLRNLKVRSRFHTKAILVPRGRQIFQLEASLTSPRAAQTIASHCSQIHELILTHPEYYEGFEEASCWKKPITSWNPS